MKGDGGTKRRSFSSATCLGVVQKEKDEEEAPEFSAEVTVDP